MVKGRNRDTAWYAITDRDWPTIEAAYDAWLAPANFDEDGRQRTPLAPPGSLRKDEVLSRRVRLRPFAEEQLPLVTPWFTDPEVRLRLGGPDWPRRSLELQARELGPDEEFRGAQVLRLHTWLAWDGDRPVALLGGEVYDRWTTWDGSEESGPRVVRSETGPAMGAAYVVDPGLWRQGYGLATLRAWQEAPETADVRVLATRHRPRQRGQRRLRASCRVLGGGR